jgi:hypothetical protein
MKNKLMPLLLVAGGLFLLMGLRSSSQRERFFSVPPGLIPQLPNGGTIAESQLSSYGFVNVPGVGWVHNTQVVGTGQFAGQENSANWLQTLSNMIQQGLTAFQIVQGTGLIPAITRSVSAISTNFPTSVSVKIMIGDIKDTVTVTKTTDTRKVSPDGKYSYSVINIPGKAIIILYIDGVIKQQSEIIWNTQQLVNFQPVGIGSICSAGAELMRVGESLGGTIMAHCRHKTIKNFVKGMNAIEERKVQKAKSAIQGLKDGPHTLY